MNVVDRIGSLPTRGAGPFTADVPDPLIGILSVTRVTPDDEAATAEWPALVLSRIDEALAEGDHASAMTWFRQYRATCLPVDTAFTVDEATSASATGQNEYARRLLTEYFATAEPDDPNFARAIELLNNATKILLGREDVQAHLPLAR